MAESGPRPSKDCLQGAAGVAPDFELLAAHFESLNEQISEILKPVG